VPAAVDALDAAANSYAKPFNVSFNPDQTVIVGVSGSGKSTMVALLLRMITGPFELPAGRSEEELGQIRPEAARFDSTSDPISLCAWRTVLRT
jgi:ABC-type nitrate/sulfonate/bicarbonate transport system ATPase subunit